MCGLAHGFHHDRLGDATHSKQCQILVHFEFFVAFVQGVDHALI